VIRLLARALPALALLIAVVSLVSGSASDQDPAADSTRAHSDRPQVDVLTWEGPVQPIMSETVIQAIDRAEKAHREALVIRLDTPGGLDTSMRDIIKRILISEVPVVVYVAPSGGRAASAGTFIGMSRVLQVARGSISSGPPSTTIPAFDSGRQQIQHAEGAGPLDLRG
jgi:membrane-bound ClpP family serine protease